VLNSSLVPWLLDPNRALLLLVELSCAVLLARAAHRWHRLRHAPELRDAAGTALLVGTVCFLSYRVWPQGSAYVSGALWGGLLVAPTVMIRAANRLALSRRLGLATVLFSIAARLRPFAGLKSLVDFHAGLGRLARGDREGGFELWRRLEEPPGALTVIVAVEKLAVDGKWAEIADRLEAELERDPASAPSLLMRYTRALGETGRLDTMFEVLGRHGPLLTASPTLLGQCLLPAFAFTGRVERLGEVLAGPFEALDATSQAAWLGTAKLVRGRTDEGLADLSRALQKADSLQRQSIERRLARPPLTVESALGSEARRVLDGLEREWTAAHRVMPACLPRRTAWVTWLVAASLVGIFLLEASRGSSTRRDNLLALGALDPTLVLKGEWWRLVAAQWLHYGPIHLGFNLAGLGLLGGRVERALGGPRTALVYLAAGTLGMVAHTLLVALGLMPPAIMVGASGGVMGLAGAAGAIALGGWRRQGVAAARRELGFIVLLVVAQAAMDLSLPGVSFLAHAVGAAGGFALAGLMVDLGWRLWFGVTIPALALSLLGEQGASRLPWRRLPCAGGDVAECKASCELGVLESCAALGYKYASGEDVPRDYARARVLLTRACGGGLAEACTDLGVLYQGEGGPPDPVRAYGLFRTACQGGSTDGCRKQGIALWYGRGTGPDRERARALFERACRAGDQRSCEFLQAPR
jgi:rhomboid protease GluP